MIRPSSLLWLKVLDIYPRLATSLLGAGLVFVGICPLDFPGLTDIILIWNTGVYCFLGLTGLMFALAQPHQIRWRAQQENASNWIIFIIVVGAALISLGAVISLVHSAKSFLSTAFIAHLILSVISVLGSWLLVHTSFALRYAHSYYKKIEVNAEQQDAQGLEFPNEEEPDY